MSFYGKEKGLTYEEIEANKAQYRADLIALGNWGRAQDPDYWLKKILEQVNARKKFYKNSPRENSLVYMYK
mgnify:CR=1 FL=1